ncbi:hypothetical protein P74p101 [Thermus phage P74-26]|uniref:Uncharacterized protein n=1 Tax=Thermus phage P74-26 TaxID=2914007 RepID=A7XXT2_BP742|nr:hypothetical protein P74p101 [Thermus phage P74-26]ABU97051.1 hypothetical protein P74p101 [Thermus phage P74-26]
MPYLPHAAMASMRDLAGRITEVRIVDKGDNARPRYSLKVNVALTQMPRSTTIRGVKFFGPLSIPHPNGGSRLTANSGNYDNLISALSTHYGGNLKAVENYLTSQLKNLPVMLQTIGGVWVISQL